MESDARTEAERRYVDEPEDELETNALWGKELARTAFVAGAEWQESRVKELEAALEEINAALPDGIKYSPSMDGYVISDGPDEGTVLDGIGFSPRFAKAIQAAYDLIHLPTNPGPAESPQGGDDA